MNTRIFRILAMGVLVSLLTANICDARTRIKRRIPKTNEYVSIDEIHKLGLTEKDLWHTDHMAASGAIEAPASALYQRVSAIRHYESKDYLRWYSSVIEPIADNYVVVVIEHPIIAEGEWTRVKFYFDNKYVERIVVEGIGETTPEHIKSGEFEIVVIPKKTAIFKSTIYTKDSEGNRYSFSENRRIIVVAPNKLNRIMEKRYTIDIKDHSKNKIRYQRFLDEIAGDVPDPNWGVVSHNAKMVELFKNSAKVPETDIILQQRTEIFDNYNSSLKDNPLKPGEMLFVPEHQVIARGNSTRVKFLFNSRDFERFEIENVGESSVEDIRKGEYIATLKPEKTTLFRCTYYKVKNGYKTKHRSNFRIIVIAPDKYDEVMKKLYILRKLGGSDYREYLDKLAGGVRSF
ncbi:MAG: hypothetical protein J6R62_01430 [Rikenellaceae bacterium]|nr:hypothetical protein [Rikenellaceae bacterium]